MSRATKRKLRQVTRERDDARRIAEEAQVIAITEEGGYASEWVLPWQDHDETVRRLGGCPECGMQMDDCQCDEEDEEAE